MMPPIKVPPELVDVLVASDIENMLRALGIK